MREIAILMIAILLLRGLLAGLVWICNRTRTGKPFNVPGWDMMVLGVIIAFFLSDGVRHFYFSVSK